MFDDQHELSNSSALRGKPARMRVALSATAGIHSALAPLVVKETGFLISEYRQASEQQELAHKSTCPKRDSLRLLIWTASFRQSVSWVQA